jgi:ribosomal protein L37E
MNAITKRYEFVFLFDVSNSNPNGAPDAGNMLRHSTSVDRRAGRNPYRARQHAAYGFPPARKRRIFKDYLRSRPAWARGLKLDQRVVAELSKQSRPTWARGLKRAECGTTGLMVF